MGVAQNLRQRSECIFVFVCFAPFKVELRRFFSHCYSFPRDDFPATGFLTFLKKTAIVQSILFFHPEWHKSEIRLTLIIFVFFFHPDYQCKRTASSTLRNHNIGFEEGYTYHTVLSNYQATYRCKLGYSFSQHDPGLTQLQFNCSNRKPASRSDHKCRGELEHTRKVDVFPRDHWKIALRGVY